MVYTSLPETLKVLEKHPDAFLRISVSREAIFMTAYYRGFSKDRATSRFTMEQTKYKGDELDWDAARLVQSVIEAEVSAHVPIRNNDEETKRY